MARVKSLEYKEYIFPQELQDFINDDIKQFVLGLGDQLETDKEADALKPPQCKCKMTDWDLSVKNENINNIVTLVCNIIDRDFSPPKHSIKRTQTWGVIYDVGDQIESHNHAGDRDHGIMDYSWTYYIQVPEGSSSLFLVKDDKEYEVIPQKAKEFFNQIIALENSNPDIRLQAEKRLNRDLSE